MALISKASSDVSVYQPPKCPFADLEKGPVGASGVAELDRSMKSRHLNMIAIGGSIGAGFFVGSGSALTRGGPASVLICFLISGVMIFNVVYALG